MQTAIVYHPNFAYRDFDKRCTSFSGEEIEVIAATDGSLVIKSWQTETEHGTAIFAKGVWAYVWTSEPRGGEGRSQTVWERIHNPTSWPTREQGD